MARLHGATFVCAVGLVAIAAGACFVSAEGQKPVSPRCANDDDCPRPEGACEKPHCASGACTVEAIQDGLAQVVPGNCSLELCQGGQPTTAPDPTDAADDADPCTLDACGDAGSTTHTPQPDGTPCDDGQNVGQCKAGVCVYACFTADDCAPGPCQAATCDTNVCFYTPVTGPAPPTIPDPPDCMEPRCDAGVLVDVVDDTDLPSDDGDPCTTSVCHAGVPGHDPVACVPPAACEPVTGVCVLAQGEACPGVAPCATGLTCVDGFCCNSTCTTLCGSCNGAETGAPSGTCAQIVNSDPALECAGTGLVCCGFDECGLPGCI